VAASLSGIKTIAIQERLVAMLLLVFRPIIDYYFTIGKIVDEWLEENEEYFAIQKTMPIGPVRTDLIHQAIQVSPDNKYVSIKKRYYLVLALDTHSEKSRFSNRRAMSNSWKSNKKCNYSVGLIF
jgi:hypothetical protein